MDDIRQRIIDEAESWVGTPFDYGCCEKGKGIDCAKFIFSVFVECDIIPRGSKTIHQGRDWVYAKNIDKDVFSREILKYGVKIPYDDRLPGDIVTFLTNDTEAHIGVIVLDDCIVHASHIKGRVVKRRLRKYKNIWSIYRAKSLWSSTKHQPVA